MWIAWGLGYPNDGELSTKKWKLKRRLVYMVVYRVWNNIGLRESPGILLPRVEKGKGLEINVWGGLGFRCRV